jgi:REP element-mobilizing transposase RayT
VRADESEFPVRKSVRLPRSAYEQGGSYYITVVTRHRRSLFGDVVSSEMRCNAAGRMVESTWRELPTFMPTVSLGAFQMMPNHLHAVLVIEACTTPAHVALPDVLQRFKSLTTRRYIDGVNAHGWPRFSGRLWQRGYHDHVVRIDQAMERIRAYIAANPARWEFDRENPDANTPIDW